MGRNVDYVRSTHSELIQLGIPDAELDWLTEQL